MPPRPGVTEPTSASVAAQLSALTAQVADLLTEMRALRQENTELRRQLDAARGVQQHQPYAVSGFAPADYQPSSPARPLLTLRTRTAGELTPEMATTMDAGTANSDAIMSSPPADTDPKRVRRSVGAELGVTGAGYSSNLAAPSGHGLF